MFEERDEKKTFEDEMTPEVKETLEPDVDDEEMTNAEVQEEIEEDNKDKIEDEIEQPFYATIPEFDELREVLVELDYRLFLINDNLVVVGRLNGADIEVLVNNGNEENANFVFVKAPETLDKLIAMENVLYLSPDMTDEEIQTFENKEANHEAVMEFLMNKLPEAIREELNNDSEELEEIPTEIPEVSEEPIEDEDIEEALEDEEEEE
jgi:hypothetical protein